MKNKITVGWLIYFSISIIIVLIGVLIQKSSLAMSIASVFGVIYSLLIAKEKRIAFFFGIINVSLYGYILLIEKMYGGAFYNLAYSLPMLIWGYIKWTKAKNEKNSGVKHISKKNKIISIILITTTIIIYSLILKYLGGSNYILDSITSVLGFVGIYLMSNKYIAQWSIWIISNFANFLLWITLTVQNISNLAIMLMWIVYLINSIYGYIVWKRSYKLTKVI